MVTQERPAETPPERPPGGTAVRVVRAVGEVLITLGLVVLLFVVYELYVTDLFSAEKQATASSQLDRDWAENRADHFPVDGESFAKLYVPSFGDDYRFTVQEGTDPAALDIGPGHYKGTAMPGDLGNFAVAGHRVGKGAPFNDLDRLGSCDAIVVETRTSFFVYRVLPHDDEIANWAGGKGTDPRCAGVPTLRDPGAAGGGPYAHTSGREVVAPDRGEEVNPVPNMPAGTTPQVALLTLTTCHPQFSDRQRLIVHAVLVKQFAKAPGTGYPDLLKAIGEG